jgi:alpha-glucoside transport system substrate-binding protein
MRNAKRVAFAGLAAVALLAAACGGDDDGDSDDTTEAPSAETTAAETTETTAGETTETTAGETGDTAAPGGDGEAVLGGIIPCDNQHDGKTVTLFSSIRDIEAERLETAYAEFEECTGVNVEHEPSGDFEEQLQIRVQGGNAPDIAAIPQPGLIAALAEDGALLPQPDLEQYVRDNFIEGFADFGTVDGTFYAAPLGANIKSLVWYSPQAFEDAGYEIPETWDEMLALSDEIAAAGGTPWCAGIESGGATGWPATDWIEDAMLRTAGPEVYDQWVNHEIPFNDPQVKEAADLVAGVLLNPDYVGTVEQIAVTAFQEGGLGILDGSCWMHRQANFYGNNFGEEVTKGPDGQVNAFFLPMLAADDEKTMLVAGEFMGIFRDAPEVHDTVQFMTSFEYANARAAESAWMSANKGLDVSVYTDPLDKQLAELLIASDVTRFDGSDLMPAEVGSGSMWTEMTNWIASGKDTQAVLDDIEATWPS